MRICIIWNNIIKPTHHHHHFCVRILFSEPFWYYDDHLYNEDKSFDNYGKFSFYLASLRCCVFMIRYIVNHRIDISNKTTHNLLSYMHTYSQNSPKTHHFLLSFIKEIKKKKPQQIISMWPNKYIVCVCVCVYKIYAWKYSIILWCIIRTGLKVYYRILSTFVKGTFLKGTCITLDRFKFQHYISVL